MKLQTPQYNLYTNKKALKKLKNKLHKLVQQHNPLQSEQDLEDTTKTFRKAVEDQFLCMLIEKKYFTRGFANQIQSVIKLEEQIKHIPQSMKKTMKKGRNIKNPQVQQSFVQWIRQSKRKTFQLDQLRGTYIRMIIENNGKNQRFNSFKMKNICRRYQLKGIIVYTKKNKKIQQNVKKRIKISKQKVYQAKTMNEQNYFLKYASMKNNSNNNFMNESFISKFSCKIDQENSLMLIDTPQQYCQINNCSNFLLDSYQEKRVGQIKIESFSNSENEGQIIIKSQNKDNFFN